MSKKQGGPADLLPGGRDASIAKTVATDATALSESTTQGALPDRNAKITVQHDARDREAHRSFDPLTSG